MMKWGLYMHVAKILLTASVLITASSAFASAESAKTGALEVEPGVSLHYELAGDGPPIVFIPGWTFTTAVFEHQIAHFAGSYQTITYDPRSQGQSTVTSAGNDYATHGNDLGVLLDALEVENPILVSWSWGCHTAWEFIKARGVEAVKANVCIDAPPIAMSETDGVWADGGVSAMAEGYQLLGSTEDQEGFVTWFADEVMIEQELTPELTEWVVGQSLSSPPWVASLLWASGSFSNHEEVAKEIDSAIPSHFFVADWWADVAKAYVASTLPNTSIENFGGHMMFWEYPDRFNASLEAFLATVE